MPPYVAYLVFGYVLDSIGDIVPNASIKVKTSITTKSFSSDSDGIYLFDLATVGYVSGETVKVSVTGPSNNELLDFTFVVEGFWREADITLAVRTLAIDTTGGAQETILKSVGNNPITIDNPLPTKNTADPIAEYAIAGNDDNNRIYGYLKKNGAWFIMDMDASNGQILYTKGSSDFITNWNNRANLTYETFDVVFG